MIVQCVCMCVGGVADRQEHIVLAEGWLPLAPLLQESIIEGLVQLAAPAWIGRPSEPVQVAIAPS